MPVYDYRCTTCGADFEMRQSFSDDTLTVCPPEGGPVECESRGEGQVKKIFSGVGISFKGEGFYKNDHGANAGGRAKEDATSSSDSKSGSESTSKSGSESSSNSDGSSKSSSESTSKSSSNSKSSSESTSKSSSNSTSSNGD